jgi:hypothetical protein
MIETQKSRAFELFRTAIDDVLSSPLPTRGRQIEIFLKELVRTSTNLSDLKSVVSFLPQADGGARGKGQIQLQNEELYLQLTEAEKLELSAHLFEKVNRVTNEIRAAKDLPKEIEDE